MKTTLQRHIASARTTDPWPERNIPRYAVTAADCHRKPKTRSTGILARAMAMFGGKSKLTIALIGLAVICRADTYITDIYGHVIAQLPWPIDHDIYVPVPTVSGPPLPFPPSTPKHVPTPMPATPKPVSVSHEPLPFTITRQ